MSQPYQLANSSLVQDLWQRQKGSCALCGQAMLKNRFDAPHATIWARKRATIDHILPRSKSGSDAPDNLQLVHAHCNKRKGAKQLTRLSPTGYLEKNSGID